MKGKTVCTLLCSLVLTGAYTEIASAGPITWSGPGEAQFTQLINEARMIPWFNERVWDPITNSKVSLEIELVNTKGIWIDQWCSKKVDVFDILRFPKQTTPRSENQIEMLVHVLWEHYARALSEASPEIPKIDFCIAHDAAIKRENEYREMGSTPSQCTKVKVRQLNPRGTRICTTWKKNNKTVSTPSYQPIPNEVSKGKATLVNNQKLGSGIEQYTFQMDPLYPNVDTLTIPSTHGGGVADLVNLTATIVIETGPYFGEEVGGGPGGLGSPGGGGTGILTKPSTEYRTARVVSLNGTAPAVPLAFPWVSSGPNITQADPSGLAEGFHHISTGHFVIRFSGCITNDLFLKSSPLPFYSQLTGQFVPGLDTEVIFETSAELVGVEPGETWTHEGL